MRTFKLIIRLVGILLFATGIILMGINIYGLFRTMRNPEIYSEQNITRREGIKLKPDETKKELKRKPGESDKDFAIRANNVVHSSMIHYWKNEGLEKYYLKIPVWENYIIWLNSLSKKDKRYEFVKYYKKNLERGVGLCSTHSIALKGVLEDNGIESELWDITRHVILRVKVAENEWYIMDPDYGLFVPHDRDEILENTELVRPTYANMASLYKPDHVTEYNTDFLVEVYGSEGNRIYSYNQSFEFWAYFLKWALPVILILPYSLFLFFKEPRRRGNQ
jgi:hypothetical protein